jgi:hypothetical protein
LMDNLDNPDANGLKIQWYPTCRHQRTTGWLPLVLGQGTPRPFPQLEPAGGSFTGWVLSARSVNLTRLPHFAYLKTRRFQRRSSSAHQAYDG